MVTVALRWILRALVASRTTGDLERTSVFSKGIRRGRAMEERARVQAAGSVVGRTHSDVGDTERALVLLGECPKRERHGLLAAGRGQRPRVCVL